MQNTSPKLLYVTAVVFMIFILYIYGHHKSLLEWDVKSGNLASIPGYVVRSLIGIQLQPASIDVFYAIPSTPLNRTAEMLRTPTTATHILYRTALVLPQHSVSYRSSIC